MRHRLRSGTALLLGGLLWPLLLHAYPDGAPPGHTGGPGEDSCRACHDGGNAAEDAGLRLDGLPSRYEPGTTYRFTLILDDPTAKVAGFQLRFFPEDDRWQGEPVGTLKAVDTERVQVQSKDGIPYLGHLKAAKSSDKDTVTWQVKWQAPEEARGPLTVYAAAVAGNDDASSFGDNVHVLDHRLDVSQ